jgi:RNA polymerase sigma-70 factor (ECF subfamily)
MMKTAPLENRVAQSPIPTRELVLGCQKGERTAQSDFYQRYRSEVARTVHRVLGPDADLEDVVQDVFVEVFRSIEKFKGDAKITTWLYRVCVNVALQKIRRHKRRPEGYAVSDEELPAHTETPLRELERKDSARIVYALLDELAPKKRVVFILHEILGLEAKEISEIVGANVLTVRTRLHYARKEFYERALESRLHAAEVA